MGEGVGTAASACGMGVGTCDGMEESVGREKEGAIVIEGAGVGSEGAGVGGAPKDREEEKL